jgi:hypothetical protein
MRTVVFLDVTPCSLADPYRSRKLAASIFGTEDLKTEAEDSNEMLVTAAISHKAVHVHTH